MMFRHEAIDRCKKLGYEVRIIRDMIKPEGYAPMTESAFKDWVRTQERNKLSRRPQ